MVAEKDFLRAENKQSINNDIPLISVVITAYNVEAYINKTIDSVLSQKTKYNYEIIIGEDCSTDRTKEILLQYQQLYPNKIKLILQEKNIGVTPNFIASINYSRAKYIALLDGDDYWTNKSKLEKQIEFLETNSHYSGSAHQSLVIYYDTEKSHLFGIQEETDFDINDTISNRKFHTSSLIFRKYIWDKCKGIPENIAVSNDRAIFPMIAIFGRIKYFKEPMCVYRKTQNGISTNSKYEQIKTDLNIIPWLYSIDKNFPCNQFNSYIHYSIFSNSPKITKINMAFHYLCFVFFSFSYFPKNLRNLKNGSVEFFIRFFIKNQVVV